MTKIKNSLSSIVSNLVSLQRDNTEKLTKLSEIVNSDTDTVTLNFEDIANGNVKSVTVPSLGSILKNIERLDENIKQISALNNKDASVQLPDGTFRTIVKSTLKKSADDITSIQTPTEFESKNNWFFESFLNPYLYVGLNFPDELNPNTIKCQIQKFILNIDNDVKLNIYNNDIKNNPDLSYFDFLDIINTNGILYTIDDEVVDLPPVEPRYYGNFNVLRVFESNENVIIDGIDATKKVQKFQLDKLSYNDKNSATLETQQLRVGDSLLVNKNDKNTRYTVSNIDYESSTISVNLAEGYDSVSIGSEILSFYPGEDITPEIQVGIGFNEYLSVFLKPIDPDSNRPADNFSPGISFYSSDLTIKDNDDVIKSLDTYYQEKVVDFGAALFSMTQENIPPVSKAVIPNSPSLNTSDFKVTQINKHVTDGVSNEGIKSLNKDKLSLSSELGDLDKAISMKRQEISTKNYKSNIERDTDNNQINTLINKRTSTESLYNSVITDILTKAQDKSTSVANAKYRVRGFWSLPTNKVAKDGSEQKVIQFKIEYRYLTKGGAANSLEEFNFTDIEGQTQKGVYSNWIQHSGPLSERSFDINTGRYYWVDQNTENGEQININQLDIPIHANETVEIRIKSVSEAGYPTTPVNSEWSNILSIEFPENLGVSKDVLSIVKETNDDNVKVQLNSDLIEKGVFTHIDDQFTQNNITWKHDASKIASGFLSDERNIISLLDYLKQQQEEIDSLKAQINKAVGVLQIKIEDESGNQQIVSNNQVVRLDAGNYIDAVSGLDNPKGEILSRNYFIDISNTSATPILLFSSLSTNVNSGSKYQAVETAEYQLPTFGINNPPTDDLDNLVESGGTAFRIPYQSRQVKGQFIYLRKSDITTSKTLYSTETNNLSSNQYTFNVNRVPSTASGNYKQSVDYFIWDGSQPTSGEVIGVEGEDAIIDPTTVYVHCQHPDLYSVPKTTDETWIAKNTSVSIFSNKRQDVDTNYFQQSGFISGIVGDDEKITNKTSFQENDKYLIGPASCGAYLYTSPISYEDVRVDGTDYASNKELSFGSANSLRFQIVFQARMTDYFGSGISGTGRIFGRTDVSNVRFSKTLGFDILYNNVGAGSIAGEKTFKFDLEVSCKYKSSGISANDVPNRIFQNTLSQSSDNLSQITPTIN